MVLHSLSTATSLHVYYITIAVACMFIVIVSSVHVSCCKQVLKLVLFVRLMGVGRVEHSLACSVGAVGL